jgi:hypothetical protein
MPIYQNKSNYMNYSQFKKNEQSVLLYGNDSKFWINGNYPASSSATFTECVKAINITKPTVQVKEDKKDFSKIIMEGRRVPRVQVHHPRSHQDQRVHKSHPKCQCDSGKLRRKIVNWAHKIPFCLDAKWWVESGTEESYSHKHRISVCNLKQKARALDMKIKSGNLNVRVNKELHLKQGDHSNHSHKIR